MTDAHRFPERRERPYEPQFLARAGVGSLRRAAKSTGARLAAEHGQPLLTNPNSP